MAKIKAQNDSRGGGGAGNDKWRPQVQMQFGTNCSTLKGFHKCGKCGRWQTNMVNKQK